MKRLAVLVIFISIMFQIPAYAQGGASELGEHISRFDSQILIDKQNVAHISETIDYDFSNLQRHGIKRFIPHRTKVGNSGKFYYYEFNFENASIDDLHVTSKISRDGEYELLQLGDADRTVSGRHSYTIKYTISPVIVKDDEGDYFNWNLTGNYWEVPIAQAKATITFDSADEVIKQRCYTGVVESKQSNCFMTVEDKILTVASNGIIGPGSGMTVNALVTKKSVNNYLQATKPPLPNLWPLAGVVFGLGAITVGIVRKIRAMSEHRRMQKQLVIVAQYEAPDNLSPGEIGHLSDNSSSMAEITATIIHLAVRGYLKIEQTQTKGLLKKADYTFHRLKDSKDLKDYEKQLLDMLLPVGAKQTKISSIEAAVAAPVIAAVKGAFKENLNKKGYYITASSVPKKTFWKRRSGFLFFLVLLINLYSLTGPNKAPFNFVLFSLIFAIVGAIIGAVIAYTIKLTESGYDEWAKVEGLKLYLTVAEKDRMNFHESPAKTPEHFSALLPYAIALGVEKDWAKQFEGIDISNQASWYSGGSNQVFNSAILASSLSNDFSSSISSNFTPTQSSSGFSGGGSSGGGGGGGGGGSW